VALAVPLIKEVRMQRGSRILWWLCIITIASLHLTLNRRWSYLLPMLGPLCVLMAWTGLAIGEALLERGRAWIWRGIVLLHIAAGPLILIYLHQRKPPMLQPAMWMMASLGGIALIAAGLLLLRRHAARECASRGMVLAAGVSIALMIAVGLRATLWNVERYHRRDFGLEVARALPAGASLIGNHQDWQQEQYYLHRAIPSYEKPRDLTAALRQAARAGGEAWLLTSSRKPLEPLRGVELHERHSRSVQANETLTLWRVRVLQ
jgi:4-amino-4-deoxy-L-arabinose transferase-like glycosyltransferase